MTKLISVPTFTFNQGDIFNMEESPERPVHVDFYNNCICIRQDGEYDKQEEIIISTEYFEQLFKDIKKNLPEAKRILESRFKNNG